MKRCSKCGIVKSFLDFYKRKDRPDGCGFMSQCKECRQKRGRDYYRENKRTILSKKSVYYQKVREDRIVYRHNRRAIKNSVLGNITADDLHKLFEKQKGLCVLCGKKISDYHVDHIHPISKGGMNEISNLQLLCPNCNKHKADKVEKTEPDYLTEVLGLEL